jgi:hypothetical protein
MKSQNTNFYAWLAGIIDGDGNFDLRPNATKQLVLKAIRVKVHCRDIAILDRIKSQLQYGRITKSNSKPYATNIVSTKKHMRLLVNAIEWYAVFIQLFCKKSVVLQYKIL